MLAGSPGKDFRYPASNRRGSMKMTAMFCAATAIATATGEEIVTSSPAGHMLHHRQAFSPDGRYLYFDSRNDETRLAESPGIGRLDLQTGAEEIIYRTATTSPFGPGCGAVTCSPESGDLAFIHGLANASEEHPYQFSSRFAGSISPDGGLIHLDARDVSIPYTPGSLRGGTHAHHWSPDGSRISFTYNDALIPKGSDELRTVGVMEVGKRVNVADPLAATEFSGSCFTTTIAKVTLNPKPGSDEMSRAFDEGWIDKNHLAFQGNVLTEDGRTVTEVFIATLPDDLSKLTMPAGPGDYPQPPEGIVIKRITRTQNDADAGVTGPRHWLRPHPDGKMIAFLDTDENGVVQIFSVSTAGGDISILSKFDESVEGPFNWSPDGKRLACASGGRIWLVDPKTGNARALTDVPETGSRPCCSVVFSPDGEKIAYNRFLPGKDGKDWLQICLVEVGGEP